MKLKSNRSEKERGMKDKPLPAACRWTARILGTLLVVLIFAIAVGEGMPNPFTQPLDVRIGFLALALTVAGILAGWRWEFSGGILSLGGWLLFIVSVVSLKRLNWFLLLLALPGILYLASALLSRRKKGQMS